MPKTKPSNIPSAEPFEGSVKEAIGERTGHGRVEAEGRRRKREAASTEADTPRAD